jgi:inorganic pyrophosphatase
VELRGEALSITNTPHFSNPNNNMTSISNFGYVTGTLANDGGACTLQLGVKFNF